MNRYYIKTCKKIKHEKVIFLISDLHYFEPKNIRKFQMILKEVKSEKPDYICIAGDLLDSANVKEQTYFIQFLKECSLVSTIIIGIGNHDITVKKRKNECYVWNDRFWNAIKSIDHIVLLDNDVYETEDLCITGITLPYEYYYEELDANEFLKKHLKVTNKEKVNILLIHDPSSIVDYNIIDFDFVLSGHTHNGMVPKILEPIFKNRGFISPRKTLFPKKVRGNFQIEKTNIIVSGGFTKLSKRSKLNFFDWLWKHEITKITIKPE